MEKPVVVISACLNGYFNRYNGGTVSDDAVNALKPRFELINICPEVEIGLGVPRKTISLFKLGDRIEVIQRETGLNLTQKLIEYSEKTINSLPEVDGFILKARSPSCGPKSVKVFGNLEATTILGQADGLFPATVRRLRPHLPLIDEGRLKNGQLRWEFLARVYLHFLFRQSSQDIKSLIDFHSRAKYLFMSISQKDLKVLGQILAGHQKGKFKKTVASYRQAFQRILTKPIRKSNLFNALSHLFGYISPQLNPQEKRHFLNLLEKYRAGKTDFVVIIEGLRAYGYRFNWPYLLDQYLLTLE
ncbi:MAG: YbgA family protein [Candidatus Saccharicenans sp.]